jgi:tetratricopeptide (TPR) repeat protein
VEFLKRIVARVRSNGSQKKASGEMASLLGLAAQYLQAQDYSAARRCLKRALESRPEMEDPQVLAGVLGWLFITWEETDQYRESTEFFSEHISKYPGDAIAYTLRANSLWYAGELPAAIDDSWSAALASSQEATCQTITMTRTTSNRPRMSLSFPMDNA